MYLLELIAENKSNGALTHIALLDYKGAFNTINHFRLVAILEEEYGINGNMAKYIRLCLCTRWGRVEIDGYYSEWRSDIIGVGQGWPPSSILYILVAIDIDVVNTLDLHVKLILYADDSTLVTVGNASREVLEHDLNWAIEIVHYISLRLGLILQSSKQRYFVISSVKKEETYREQFLNITVADEPMVREFESVRFLGLHLDRRLNWKQHIGIIERNATRAYVLIYNRFKNSRAVSAEWVSTMMRSFVLSKIAFLSEVWTNTTQRILTPISALYKRMTRFCQRASLSSPVLYDCMIGEWPSWEEWVAARQGALLSRVLRTPDTNIRLDGYISTLGWNT